METKTGMYGSTTDGPSAKRGNRAKGVHSAGNLLMDSLIKVTV